MTKANIVDSRVPKNGDLIINRKGGGSVVDSRPVFSYDGKILFVVWGPVIRSYSTHTGELVRSYEGLKGSAVGVCLHPKKNDHLVSCSERGELIEWAWQTTKPGRKLDLIFPEKNSTPSIINFDLIISTHEKCLALVVWMTAGEEALKLDAFDLSTGKIMKGFFPNWRFDKHRHSIAVGGIGKDVYVTGIKEKNLYIIQPNNNIKQREQIGGARWFTCVACHPQEPIIATGDNSGRILVWRGIGLNSKLVYSVYHWHTLPVQDVTFSSAGNHLYSGGGEAVLVKWVLDVSKQRNFLPRLPAPIEHLVVSSDNRLIAISTQDNAIQIVDPLFKLVSTIQHFSWGVRPITKTSGRPIALFPAGLTVDPRTQSLVLNGRTGHIQFFSSKNKTLLYNMDITGQNILTQERENLVINTEVVKVAFSTDGEWLATVEQRHDGETSPDLRLKFWNYDDVKQIFSLNTFIDLPHKSQVFALQFQPIMISNQLFAVTTGDDMKFRIWGLRDSINIHENKSSWSCESVGFYRNLPAGDISFSNDGSLLAVAFGHILTVWIPETNQLKCSLTNPQDNNAISHVEFGHKDCLHLVVTGSKTGLCVWNLITLTIVWTVPFSINILTSDPQSNVMAAVSTNNDLIIFAPISPHPIFKQLNLCKPKILTAVFVPHTSQTFIQIPWQQHSQFYFLDSNQELLVLEEEQMPGNFVKPPMLPALSNLPQTPFSALIAQQSKSSVSEKSGVQLHVGIPGERTIKELLQAPAHTMPSISLLCGSVLRSLMTSKSREGKEKSEKEAQEERMSAEDTGIDSDDSEDSRNVEVVSKVNKSSRAPTKPVKHQNNKEFYFGDLDAKLEKVREEKFDWVSRIKVE